MTTIKLIKDKFENDFGFLEGVSESNLTVVISQIESLSCQHQPERVYSWGIKKEPVSTDCELVFDVSLFFTKIEDRGKLSSMTGLDSYIQKSILSHPRFMDLLRNGRVTLVTALSVAVSTKAQILTRSLLKDKLLTI